ncbi:MAG: restriction endonuclease subunit S, partial [Waterburya sp.]
MAKLTASQKRLIDNATLNVASQLIFRKLEELNFPQTKVGNICSVCRGGSPRPKGDPKYFGGSIPWIMISDVSKSKGRYIYSTYETVTEEGAKKSRLLNKGTLIVTNSATIGLPKILGIDGCIHDGFLAFLDLSSDIERDFLYCFFIKIRSYLETNAPQGTQKNINTNIVKSLEIPIPPIELQKAISTFIKSVELRQNGDKTIDLPDLPIPLNNIKDAVAKVEELAGKIEEARSLREQTIKETSILYNSALSSLINSDRDSWKQGKIADVILDMNAGWSPQCEKYPASEGEWGV